MKYSVFIKIIDLKYRGCCSITHDNREYIINTLHVIAYYQKRGVGTIGRQF